MFVLFLTSYKKKDRKMLDEVKLEEIPFCELETKFPGYMEWYAEEIENSIKIFKKSSELFFDAKQGKAMTDYEYYNRIYEEEKFLNNRKLLKRESCYEIVNWFYDIYLKGNEVSVIDKKQIDFEYELDDFYCNVKNWGDLRWKE